MAGYQNITLAYRPGIPGVHHSDSQLLISPNI
jgi:hypothetical protein